VWQYKLNLERNPVPGPRDSLVVVQGVDGQDGDPGADVDQQHGEGVVKATGGLDAALRVRGVAEVEALRVAVEAHPVHEEQTPDQAVQLVQLTQLQGRDLHRQTGRQTGRRRDRQVDKQVDTGRRTDGETQVDRQTHIHR